MAEERRCGQCGKGLPADAPGGLCPECLLKVGLESQSQEPAGQGAEGTLPTASYGREADGSPAEARDVEVVLTQGQQFGGYRIVHRLGSGGMGTVYEADHLESGRRVALKVLGHRLDSPEAKQRFLREGRLAASVNHPNSVYVFGTEEIAGVPVIAMELVPGGTLEERVRRGGPLPVGEAVDAILQVIDGLEAAEAGGVLHRDVKAANCFMDREGTVKVGDFGLSISTSLRGDSNLTDGGTFLGTPAFSSPEQLRGDELDIRSDIYAVGVTLFYLLTGRMPYRAENLVRLIATVLEHPARSPAELRPEIPKSLARAVLRCLQKQPAARFRTYDELRQALAPFGSSAPTPAAFGLRLGAGIVDHLLWSSVGSCLTIVWIGDFERMYDPSYFGTLEQSMLMAIGLLLHVLYFAVPEGLWGASPGKAICGVRVVNPRRSAPGLPKALARAAVYVVFPMTVGLVCAGLVGVGVLSEAPMWLLQVLSLSSFALWALMFSTARRRNGYAGFHDHLSNTRVVLKSVYRSRPVLSRGGEPPAETEATPTVGPYHVLSSLGETGASELLLGYDTRLLRRVWIRTLADGEPAVAVDVRDLGRPGRLRWLAGRRAPGECWDAYEAPAGNPLVHLLDERRPWESVRYWLVDLAEELAAGAKHESLPAVLALDRVWITREGRAKLLDFPAPGVDPEGPWAKLPGVAGDDSASAGPFLNSVAIAALEGRAVEREEASRRAVAVPVPLHARSVMDELPGIEGPEHFVRRLEPLLGRTPSIRRARRLGLVAAILAPICLFAATLPLGMSMNRRWHQRHPEVTPLYYCLEELERLDALESPPDDAQQQQRRALEVYVAGRFGETISDRAVRHSPVFQSLFNQSFFKKDKLEIAERAVKDHPDPSEKEVTEAAAQLGPFLDEMPDVLPGVRELEDQMPTFLVSVPVGFLLAFAAVPGMICAVLFRGGLLMYIFGIAVVTKNGSRASRLRAFWRSLVTWSPFVLAPMLMVPLTMIGLDETWSLYLVLALLVAVIVRSVSMPVRGIPDRLAGTYPVPR